MATCRSCGAEIRWVTTLNGKRIPLDREPSPDGNVFALETPQGWRASVLGPDEDPPAGRQRYMAHFATCPDADAWRVNKKEHPNE